MINSVEDKAKMSNALARRVHKIDSKDVYTADFETTSTKNLEVYGCVRVYLWSLVNIETRDTYHGNDIESFFEKLDNLKVKRVYFHNLDFDGQFILHYMLSKDMIHDYNFRMLSPDNSIMEMVYMMSETHKVEFRCSLKKALMSVNALANLLNIPSKHSNLSSDGKQFWDRVIPDDYQPTQEEIDYCIHDSEITAEYMAKEYEAGRTALTAAGEAFLGCRKYISKHTFGIPKYEKFFKKYPLLSIEQDAFARGAYKGGVCMVNPDYIEKELENIYVLDVKSMYPYVMTSCRLPFGVGRMSYVEPEEGELYIVKFLTAFKVKDGKGKVPFVQLKNSSRFATSEHIKESDIAIPLCLTNIDYKLFKEHYDVYFEGDHEWLIFESDDPKTSELSEYIRHLMVERAKYSKKDNPYLNKVYKDLANMTYGAFGLNPLFKTSTPVLTDKDVVRIEGTSELGDGRYVPVAVFVTSYARKMMIDAISINSINDSWIYTDTDSMHLLKEGIGVDIGNNLGQWEYEGESYNPYKPYPFAKYLRPKTYILLDENKKPYKSYNKYGQLQSSITCAGMTDSIKEVLQYEDFYLGAVIQGKRSKRKCPGGCVILEGGFTINDTNHH